MPGLAQKVIQSIFFRKAQQKAFSYLKDRNRLLFLLQQAGRHINAISQKQASGSVLDDLRTMMRMVNAYRLGTYRTVPWQTLTKVVAVLIYFVSPLDFVPDILPVLGFTDDFALIFWTLRSFAGDIEAFKAWETQSATAESANFV